MTELAAVGEAPAGFTLDQDTELRSPAQGNATVRYVGHTLDTEDMRRHIEAGKQCMRLAMTWNDRVSFVLTPSLTIKRITPLDVLKEASDPTAQNDDERFDSDVTLMTAELDACCATARCAGRRAGLGNAASCGRLNDVCLSDIRLSCVYPWQAGASRMLRAGAY